MLKRRTEVQGSPPTRRVLNSSSQKSRSVSANHRSALVQHLGQVSLSYFSLKLLSQYFQSELALSQSVKERTSDRLCGASKLLRGVQLKSPLF